MLRNNDVMKEMARSRQADISHYAADQHKLKEAGITPVKLVNTSTAELMVAATLTTVTIAIMFLL